METTIEPEMSQEAMIGTMASINRDDDRMKSGYAEAVGLHASELRQIDEFLETQNQGEDCRFSQELISEVFERFNRVLQGMFIEEIEKAIGPDAWEQFLDERWAALEKRAIISSTPNDRSLEWFLEEQVRNKGITRQTVSLRSLLTGQYFQ